MSRMMNTNSSRSLEQTLTFYASSIRMRDKARRFPSHESCEKFRIGFRSQCICIQRLACRPNQFYLISCYYSFKDTMQEDRNKIQKE